MAGTSGERAVQVRNGLVAPLHGWEGIRSDSNGFKHVVDFKGAYDLGFDAISLSCQAEGGGCIGELTWKSGDVSMGPAYFDIGRGAQITLAADNMQLRAWNGNTTAIQTVRAAMCPHLGPLVPSPAIPLTLTDYSAALANAEVIRFQIPPYARSCRVWCDDATVTLVAIDMLLDPFAGIMQHSLASAGGLPLVVPALASELRITNGEAGSVRPTVVWNLDL